MLLCWQSACANRQHRGCTARRIDWASFTEGNCTGAKCCTFVMRFFTALLKPCLDLFTGRMKLFWQGHIISSAKCNRVTFKRKRSLTLTGYLPSVFLIVHTSAYNNVTLVWLGSLRLLRLKRCFSVVIVWSGAGFCILCSVQTDTSFDKCSSWYKSKDCCRNDSPPLSFVTALSLSLPPRQIVSMLLP